MIANVRSSATENSSMRFTSKMPREATALHKPRRSADLKNRPLLLFQSCCQSAAEVSRRFDGFDTGGGHGCVFVLCGSLPAGNDCSGVAHAAAWRRGLSGDETDDRLLHIRSDPCGGNFFRVATDFADEDDGMRLRIVVEELNRIEKRRTDNGIATDADTRGLADAEACELIHGFVRERAAAADNANVARLVNASGHDADFAFAWGNYARAVGADEASFVPINRQRNTNHVENGNAFGDANNQRQCCVGSFENRVGGIRWRNENHRSVCAGGFDGFGDRVENGAFEMLRAAFAGSDAANNVRSE